MTPWSLTVCAHTSLPVHPLWLAAIFAKLPSVLSPAFLPLLTHVSHWCHPSLSLMGREFFPHLNLLCFPSHPTPPSSPSQAVPWELFAFSFWRMDFQFIIARLFLLIQNHVPHVFFFPNRNSLCCSLCLTGTCKLFIDLSCSSPCSVPTLTGLWLCLLPAAFLSSHKGEGRYTCEASIVSKNGLPLWPEV